MKSEPRRRVSLPSMETLGRLSLVLLIAELVLILLSWILSATMIEGVRSLLSGEGMRWFFGRFAEIIASPLLAWLVLLLIAVGCLVSSGLSSALSHLVLRAASPAPRLNYRDRLALRLSLAFLLVYVVVILLLTAMPHAVLLSATGSLFPSAFSDGLVPALSFGLVVVSIAYGVMSGRFHTLADILESLSVGIRGGAPFFLLYVLLIQLYESLWFVFG